MKLQIIFGVRAYNYYKKYPQSISYNKIYEADAARLLASDYMK